MVNRINQKGIYKTQIEELQEAISYLEESDNKLGFDDDGSGKEYTAAQHKIGYDAKQHAINCIESALMKLCNISDMKEI